MTYINFEYEDFDHQNERLIELFADTSELRLDADMQIEINEDYLGESGEDSYGRTVFYEKNEGQVC